MSSAHMNWGVWIDKDGETVPFGEDFEAGMSHDEAVEAATVIYYEGYRPAYASDRIYLRSGIALFPFRPSEAYASYA